MPRSNALTAGVLAPRTGIPFEEAVRKVLQEIGEQNICIEVLQAVRQAIHSTELSANYLKQKRILITGGGYRR